MTNADNKDDLYFGLAYELAYFIHVNKETACFVAEDALAQLPVMLGKQGSYRKPSGLLSGFWKGGERSRPIRRTLKLNERQMLQWLVYQHSESWEREAEKGEGLYLPTEEDMIVRYLKQLVFITLRLGSFYVSLALGQLLHQFDRRQTRLFYDILTQSDSARMKEMGYIGKQRLELLRRICQRFDGMIQTTKTPRGERQIITQPTTQSIFKLVEECLGRFTPWETACIIESGFDVTDIPGLYFSGADIDEDRIEMDRIHTVVDPDCFARFAEGLRKYARDLPDDSLDKGCNFDSPNQLAVPQFSNFSSGPSRGDRSQPPSLAKADYVRLRRTLDAHAHRRKIFTPNRLFVYVDATQTQFIDLSCTDRVEFSVGPEAGVIEVRGRDEQEALTLGTLLVEFDRIPIGGTFRDAVVHEGGQKIEVQLTPTRNASGEVESAQVLVSYTETRLMRSISRPMRENQLEISESPRQRYAWLLKTCVTLALMAAATIFVWFQLRSTQQEVSPQQQAEQPSTGEEKPVPPATPPAPLEQPKTKDFAPAIARASWSSDPQSALRSISIEPTRGEVKQIDLSRLQTQEFLKIPAYNRDGVKYSHYRITFVAAEKRLWRQTLRAPSVSLTSNSHILALVLYPRRMSGTDPYDLQVEARTQSGWKVLGHILLNPVKR
jgi:hypothetical protein